MSEGMIWVLFWCLLWPMVGGVRYYFKHRLRIDEMKTQASLAPSAPAQEAELQMLRERVKVLERIVVDTRHTDTLAGDIEALR